MSKNNWRVECSMVVFALGFILRGIREKKIRRQNRISVLMQSDPVWRILTLSLLYSSFFRFYLPLCFITLDYVSPTVYEFLFAFFIQFSK